MPTPSGTLSTQPPSPAAAVPHWLHRYACDYYQWHQQDNLWNRPLGLIESFFDSDGTDFQGRADVSSLLTAEIRTSLTPGALQDRILLAWAIFRYQHVLVCAKVLGGRPFLLSGEEGRYFVVERKTSLGDLLQNSRQHITFLAEHYPHVDAVDFYHHVGNASRVVDPTKALGRLFVLPPTPTDHGTSTLKTIMVTAHEICDGLTVYRWHAHLIDLLNLSHQALLDYAEKLLSSDLRSRLPPAQEDLYPPITGSLARQRWRWAISRVLRHTRRPPPASFPNPLRRTTLPKQPKALPQTYAAVLDYNRPPRLTSGTITATLSPAATSRLATLCREAHITMGAGIFALVGVSMMYFHEQSTHSDQTLPFVGSFPINPRPFLHHPLTGLKEREEEDSLMLAFSDGLTLPFLPSRLDLDRRIRLLGRLAHRQLSQYQKTQTNRAAQLKLGSRSPAQLIPELYLGSIERLKSKTPSHLKTGLNPQCNLPARQSPTPATCGVSSIGNQSSLISSGKHDVSNSDAKGDLSVDFRGLQSGVRPRDDEFLVGAAGDKSRGTVGFMVSFDGDAIDEGEAERWRSLVEGLLQDAGQRGGGGDRNERTAVKL